MRLVAHGKRLCATTPYGAIVPAMLATATLLIAGGCASAPSKSWKYPPPVFDTNRAARRQAPQPAIRAPVARRGVAGEPGWAPPGGIRPRWTDIVLHHSASPKGGAVSFDRYHRTVQKWDELGYHFVIGNGTDTRDGLIEIGSRWTKQKHGAHCKTPDNYYNDHGIGICLVGDFSRSSPTRGQLASLERLLVFLTDQCRIPVSRIRTHGGVTSKTQCPGRNFPTALVQRNVALAQQRLAGSTAGAVENYELQMTNY
jgi:hypothetical protein